MKLYDRFGERGYHTSIATTFGIDFDAYENIVLPRLRGSGCHNNILIADDRMLVHALNGASSLPRHAGRIYTVTGAQAAGVFHPKIFLQLGRRGGRMIVSSANMTASGLAGNLELAGEIKCDTSKSGEQQLIAAAWHFVLRMLDESQKSTADQLSWMRQRTSWLQNAEAVSGAVSLSDGTKAALLTTGGATGIAAQYLALVGADAINRLIVISPYWDPELTVLTYLAESMSVSDIAILLDSDECEFPGEKLLHIEGAHVFDRKEFYEGRFLHAKAIIAQTTRADHVLFGSGNCTVAALGHQSFAGSNEEVCLYRQLPPGLLIQKLELDGILKKHNSIDPSSLKRQPAGEDIPLDDLASQIPGRFECRYDTLIWTSIRTTDPENVSIELLDDNGEIMDYTLTPSHSSTETSRLYQISGTEMRPAFARLRYSNSTCSAPAIVTLLDNLRNVIRETRSRPTENAAMQLADETEEGLWLLEVLDTLEAEERAQKNDSGPRTVSRAKTNAIEDNDPSRYSKLNYEAFVAGRRPRTPDKNVARNSLAGSEMSLVRGFLNRILGFGAPEDEGNNEEDEEAIKKAFDLGDETSNAEAAMEGGDEFNTDLGTKELTESEKEEEVSYRRNAHRKATKEQIIQAVVSFNERMRERKSTDELGTLDILRLRALLMIVVSAGWIGSDGSKMKHPRTSLQVLAVEGDGDSWPRLLGRVIFGLFGSKDSAIRHLQIDAIHDQMPDDLIECWATCFWCLQAALAAPVSEKERAAMDRFMKPLAEKVYRLTGLASDELLSDDVDSLFVSLSERFVERLGVHGKSTWGAHKALVRDLFKQAE